MDKDGDDKWEWNEILYVVKDFYSNIWTKDRPAVVDDDRMEGSVAEKLIEVLSRSFVIFSCVAWVSGAFCCSPSLTSSTHAQL